MAYLDFDSKDALTLVNHATEQAREVQGPRNDVYTRMDMLYHGVPQSIRRDPRRYNHFMPKPFTAVETLVPKYIRANHGVRPYMPIRAKNEEYQDIADLQEEMYDHYLEKAGFISKMILTTKIAVVQGTSFMNGLPSFEQVKERFVDWGSGEPIVRSREALRFRLILEEWAPWDLLIDPRATGLEQKDQCRYAIKIALTSRRRIKKLYEANPGSYPGIDEEALYRRRSGDSTEMTKHYGIQMLTNLGLPTPKYDDDMEVILRYESEDRYIDVLGGNVLLRSTTSNPMPHGLINLSKQRHTVKPHTQDSFWGYGALKPVETLFYLRNDLINNALDAAQAQTNFRIYYDDAQDEKQFTTLPNAMIGIKRQEGRPISDHFQESRGGSLDKDFYLLPDMVDRETELGVGVFDITTGQVPNRQATATRDVIRVEAGDIRLEMGVLEDELFLKDLLGKTSDIIGESVTIADVVEVLGIEKAMQMYLPTQEGRDLMSHPNRLPGGFDLELKGRARVAQEQVDRQVAQDSVDTIMGFPTTRQSDFQEIYMKRLGYTKEERERTIRTEGEMIEIQQRMAAEEADQLENQEVA